MQWYFLTVSDKNPIMFNDMLCEYCAVEIGLGMGGCAWWWWWWFVFRSLSAVSTAASSSPAAGLCLYVSAASLEDLWQT